MKDETNVFRMACFLARLLVPGLRLLMPGFRVSDTWLKPIAGEIFSLFMSGWSLSFW